MTGQSDREEERRKRRDPPLGGAQPREQPREAGGGEGGRQEQEARAGVEAEGRDPCECVAEVLCGDEARRRAAATSAVPTASTRQSTGPCSRWTSSASSFSSCSCPASPTPTAAQASKHEEAAQEGERDDEPERPASLPLRRMRRDPCRTLRRRIARGANALEQHQPHVGRRQHGVAQGAKTV